MLIAAKKKDIEPKRFHGFRYARDAASWPDRRRGLSNFLTWSVFLAEVIAAELFFGKGAYAAHDIDSANHHGGGADQFSDASHSLGDVSQAPDMTAPPPPGLLGAESMATTSPGALSASWPSLGSVVGHSFGPFPDGGGGGGSQAGGAPIYTANGTDSAGSGGNHSGSGTDTPGGGDGHLPGGGGEAHLPDTPGITVDTPIGSIDLPGIGVDLPGVSIDLPGIHLGGDLGDLLGLHPDVAVSLGLDLNPIDVSLGLDAHLPQLNLALDLGTPVLDLNLDAGLHNGLGLDIGLGDSVGSPLTTVTELANQTGLSIFHGLDSGGGSAPLSDIASTAQTVLSAPLSIVGDIGAQLLPSAHAADTSSGGTLQFAEPHVADSTTDSLFADGRYTDYNLSLQGETGAGGHVGSVVETAQGEIADTLGLGDDHGHGAAATHLLDHALGADQDLLRGHSI